MPTTYINLTNKLLRRLNEVPISQADFTSARGVQSMAKDAIVASVEAINQREREWPFNAVTGNQILVAGTQAYDFPVDLRSVKWDSFHVLRDDELGVRHSRLQHVARDYWDRYHKDTDYDSIPHGLDIPSMVLEKHGYGFAVSPNPNKAYTVGFEYFKRSTNLVLHTDMPTIPTIYDEAIIQGGLYHFYMFRSNTEHADRADVRFKREVEEMRTTLINKEDAIRSTVIHRNTTHTGF